nr:glycoside hydrolase family 3 C-terminal domain-containing protein [Rhodococcus sp. Leaf278]
MSLADKVSLGSGADFWSTESVGSVAKMIMTDGPHGIRRQTGASDHLGLAGSEPATCFPPAVGLGQSWDVDLTRRVGEALGREARALDADVLLGPGVNIKRDPRCGRNFEYFSEDPVVSGILGAAWVNGLQSAGVGASLKHFALNNAEHDRMRSSSDVDLRPMREIYLHAFSHVVRTASPWTVMCSYNRINGELASQNRWLLTELLRDEWGFDGVVVSDWGAVADRVAAVAAGLDLEMPGRSDTNAPIVAAVEAGTLDEVAVDRAASNMAALAARVVDGRAEAVAPDLEAHHSLAREVAARCIVLLKNDGGLLPLSPDRSIAVIGPFAQTPRYQGGGSSHVNPTRLDVPLDEIRFHARTVTYNRGFTTDGSEIEPQSSAVAAASAADVAVVFLGLGEGQESEGFDRDDIEVPQDQLELLTAIVGVQPNTVVVLAHGGVLRLAPVADAAPAILDGALLGQAGGAAIADVLFGVVNPSARLTETVPIRLQDCPSYLNFPGENSHVRYGEGIFVGYRGYDARDLPVTYPFGHGLSYSTFEYSDLVVASHESGIIAHVTVTNTGDRSGREIVQFYTSKLDSVIARPPRELKGFAATEVLEPGSAEQLSVSINRADLAYWETRTDGWIVEGGSYEVSAGASSRDIRVTSSADVEGDAVDIAFTADTTVGEALRDPAAAKALGILGLSLGTDDDALGMDTARMMADIPLGRLKAFGMGQDEIDAIIARGGFIGSGSGG